MMLNGDKDLFQREPAFYSKNELIPLLEQYEAFTAQIDEKRIELFGYMCDKKSDLTKFWIEKLTKTIKNLEELRAKTIDMKKLKLSVFNGVDCNFVTFELNLTDNNETFVKFGYEKDQPNIRF